MNINSEIEKIALDYTDFDFNLVINHAKEIKYFSHDEQGNLYFTANNSEKICIGLSKVDIVTESEHEVNLLNLVRGSYGS